MKIAMLAAHGGFGSERIPLGGGAAIFERLAAHPDWRKHDLLMLGSGPNQPENGRYVQLGSPRCSPSELSMWEYAAFCREFSASCTEFLLKERPDIVLSHDISEGPHVPTLKRAGIKVATVFHVDVVDIFSQLYLGRFLSPKTLAFGYRKTVHWPWPGLLKLVFQKQQQVMDDCDLCIVPSKGAADLLRQCYPASTAAIKVIGWGAPDPLFSEAQISLKATKLRQRFQIPDTQKVLLTLSRLSPEKAQQRLLEAVRLAEKEDRMPLDITLVVAGAPAFMEGARHAQKLQQIASELRTRVVFPGHVGGIEKAAWYQTCSLFVVNSLHESYGLTTLEAMQQGCPVVAVASSGTTDTVTSDVGILVPPGPELARRLWGSLEYLLSFENRDYRKELADNARLKAKRCTFRSAGQVLLDCLGDVTSESSESSA